MLPYDPDSFGWVGQIICSAFTSQHLRQELAWGLAMSVRRHVDPLQA